MVNGRIIKVVKLKEYTSLWDTLYILIHSIIPTVNAQSTMDGCPLTCKFGRLPMNIDNLECQCH